MIKLEYVIVHKCYVITVFIRFQTGKSLSVPTILCYTTFLYYILGVRRFTARPMCHSFYVVIHYSSFHSFSIGRCLSYLNKNVFKNLCAVVVSLTASRPLLVRLTSIRGHFFHF